MAETGGEGARGVRTVRVTESQAGQRVDNFLQRELRGVPRALVYRILRSGEVRVNGRRAKPALRLAAGDAVRIPPVRETPPAAPGRVPEAVITDLERRVLHEDGDLLVLDKPAGRAVHGGSGLSWGLIDALRQGRPHAPFLELAHRLDRDTSGCLLVAKTRPALIALQAALREGRVAKRYLALVRGRWQGGSGTVETRLRRQALRGGERVVAVDAERGRPARSRFRVRERLPGCTLMEVEIDTGRTHQIRVQAAELGHPLAGDAKYGDEGFNRRMRALGLRRQFLHAAALGLRHPREGRALRFEAPLDEALAGVLARLRAGRDDED